MRLSAAACAFGIWGPAFAGSPVEEAEYPAHGIAGCGTRHTPMVPTVRSGSRASGEYLAGPVAHCMECRTPTGPQGPMLSTDLGRGGFEFHGPWGICVAANITNHTGGLAGFSDDEVKAMIVEGKRADGSPMLPPMPYG